MRIDTTIIRELAFSKNPSFSAARCTFFIQPRNHIRYWEECFCASSLNSASERKLSLRGR